MYKLTLCMIVKNESDNIEDTLRNIVKYFNIDYWVISDTGSSDNTINITSLLLNVLLLLPSIFNTGFTPSIFNTLLLLYPHIFKKLQCFICMLYLLLTTSNDSSNTTS